MRLSKVVLIASFVFSFYSVVAQQEEPPQKDGFARFLFSSELFQFAAEEYERLLFDDPENLEYLKQLIHCYKRTKREDQLERRLASINITDKNILQDYYSILLHAGTIDQLRSSLNKRKALFIQPELDEIEFKILLAEMNWKGAKEIYNNKNLPPKYEPIISLTSNSRYKSPVGAAILSGLVPGLGRVYAKDYWDGVLSIIFVGTAGIQSYNRFKKNGIESVSGWIYGSIALGFYISNIYGTYQSALYHNRKVDEKTHTKVMSLLDTL